MATYCTPEQVAELLQCDYFSDSTKPTRQTVESIIERKEDYINSVTGHSWKEVTVSNEMHNIDVNYIATLGIPIYLQHRKIKQFDSSKGDKLEVWDGSRYVDYLTEKTEGRNNDFSVNYEEGIIYLRTFYGAPRKDAVRVTYRYGEDSVPGDIADACAKLTAIDLIALDDRSVLLPETGGSNVSYLNKIEQWKQDVKEILQRYKEFRIPSK